MNASRLKTWMGGVLLAALAATQALGQSADQLAIEAAKRSAGETINVSWPAGVGALGVKNFVAPQWEAATGVKVNVIEMPTPDLYTKAIAEHRAGTGGLDVLSVVPAWLADLSAAGILEPLDPLVEKYGFAEELQGIEPAFRDNQMRYNGKIFGIPDDGDMLILYYRKDLFENPENRAAFQAKYGYELAAPVTWKQFADIGRFMNDKYAPEIYGAVMIRRQFLLHYYFEERFRTEGGRFFDPETMKALINSETGVRVVEEMVADNAFMPPGVQEFGPVESLSTFLSGDAAMVVWWPPVGRWAEGYGANEEALKWVPKTQVAGKVGYALPPGGHPELALGWSLAVAAGSKKKDLAYLFIQYANSEKISLERVQIPYSLRDPFRTSHFESGEYRSRWPTADLYLDTLKQGAQTGMLDLSIRNTFQYDDALQKALGRAMAGEDPKTVMDDAASEWDRLTDRVGLDKQRDSYRDWAAKPNAYPTP